MLYLKFLISNGDMEIMVSVMVVYEMVNMIHIGFYLIEVKLECFSLNVYLIQQKDEVLGEKN